MEKNGCWIVKYDTDLCCAPACVLGNALVEQTMLLRVLWRKRELVLWTVRHGWEWWQANLLSKWGHEASWKDQV